MKRVPGLFDCQGKNIVVQCFAKATQVRRLVMLAGVLTCSMASNASAGATLLPMQPSQGEFASGTQQVPFEQALITTFGQDLTIKHPEDVSYSDGAPQDLLGYAVAISGDIALVGAPQDVSLTGTGSVLVFMRSGSDWRQITKLTANDAGPNTRFGTSIALDGDTAIIGAPNSHTPNATAAGAAYVFTRAGNAWTQRAKLIANDAVGVDQFGISTAISGDTILVGAMGVDLAGAEQVGAAYVFVRTGGLWQQQAKLLAADGVSEDYFGAAVALAGNTAVVGAPRNDAANSPIQHAGSAYVYVRNAATWRQEAKLLGIKAPLADYFGRAVAISGDTVLVGAPGKDVYNLNAGAAYVFARSGEGWTKQVQLFPSETTSSRYFGASVALLGSIAVIGSIGGQPRGSTHVYVRSANDWSLQAQLIASDAMQENTSASAVAISGTSVLVGTPWKNIPGVTDAGAAFVFAASGATWTEQTQLTAGNGAGLDEFGVSIALSGDTALVGAHLDDNGVSNAGSAFVFARVGAQWVPLTKLVAPDPQPDSGFGRALAIDGDIAVVGAPLGANAAGTRTGVVYVFVRSGATWQWQATLSTADAAANDRFGQAVAVSSNTIAVGAPQHDLPAAPNAGAAYVFTRSGGIWTEQRKLNSDASTNANFGADVALLGNELLIGASAANSVNALGSGAAYLFQRTGAIWSQPVRLSANDASGGAKFGSAVALDNNTILIGAPLARPQGSGLTGAAYVFARNGVLWMQQAQLTPTDRGDLLGFGGDVALLGDRALIGAAGVELGFTPPPFVGAAYAFRRTANAWNVELKFVDALPNTGFGHCVAFSQTSTSAAADWVGAPGQKSTTTGNTRVGIVYSFPSEIIFRSGFDD